MKTAISLPNDLFADAERAANVLHLSRSELYRRALTAYLQQLPGVNITAQLDAFYAEHPDTSALEPGWQEAQADAFGRDPW